VDGFNATLQFNSNDTALQLATVPEPSAWVTLLGGLALLGMLRGRRRRA
jgi:hypothetical protein